MSRILLVDDETNILAALKREIAGWAGGERHDVEAYASPQEALECAKVMSFDLVIADYKMAEMDGVGFLKAFRETQPEAMCLLLSGHADRDVLVDAINQTHIYRFIGKPWDSVELAGAVAQALAFQRVARENHRLAQACRAKFGDAVEETKGEEHFQLLVVDDDEAVLSAIWRELSHRNHLDDLYAVMRHEANPEFPLDGHEFRFTVDVSANAVEALEKVQTVAYDLVIADYRMPGMDGIRFLEVFRKLRPDAARILLSGYADLQVLIEAVNRAEIFSFVPKPWNEYELKSAVTQAIAYRKLLLENRRLSELLAAN